MVIGMPELENYAIVVAHPDDEILWFSSILSNARKIIICFGPSNSEHITQARRKLKYKFPIANTTWLELRESDCLLQGDWQKPKMTKFGIKLKRDNLKFQSNFGYLVSQLSQELIGIDNVVTHNPWGEYGHEEHTQVFAAVKYTNLYLKKISFKLFVNSYVSERSQRCRSSSNEEVINTFTIPIDKQLSSRVMEYYKQYDAWTWDDHYKWPSNDIFLELNTNRSREQNSGELVGQSACLLIDLRLPQTLSEHLQRLVYRLFRKYSILRKFHDVVKK